MFDSKPREWSAQGFGMLRTYLPGNRRLHVWTKAVYVPRATLLHTHPWDFTSTVLRGVIHNFKFARVAGEPTHNEYQLKCGQGACLVSEPSPVRLEQIWAQSICTGGEYSQTYDEIHETVAEEGTVTIIDRTLRRDADYAQTFCLNGENFVSAEPRPATPGEAELAESYMKGLDLK